MLYFVKENFMKFCLTFERLRPDFACYVMDHT